MLHAFSLRRLRLSLRPQALSCVVGACWFVTLCLNASIETKNPFLPKGYGATAPKAMPSTPIRPVMLGREIEFRGIVQIAGKYRFSLFNKKEGKGYWIQEDQTNNGISVSQFDPKKLTLSVSRGGHTEQLSLMSSNDSPIPVKSSGPVISTGASKPNVPPQNTSNKNPTSIQNLLKNTGPPKTTTTNRNTTRRRVILPRK